MIIIANKFKKVANSCYKLFKIAKLKLYNCAFSNKIYSNFTHLFLHIYKQFRKFTYEELLTDIESNSELKAYLGLKKVPHYTTLIKFAKRLPLEIIDKLIIAFKKLIPEPKKVAIDSTGISLDNASSHYCKRIGLSFKKRPFLKTTFIVDIEQYIILLCKPFKSRIHDTKVAKPMIKNLAKNYEPEIFYGDRGFDDEKIFKLCFENLNAYPLILQKRLDVPKYRRRGHYRKKTFSIFDYGEYLQRNKIETLNSMFKRKFGSNVKSRIVKLQKIEVLFRVIAFNIDRIIRISECFVLIFIRTMRVSY